MAKTIRATLAARRHKRFLVSSEGVLKFCRELISRKGQLADVEEHGFPVCLGERQAHWREHARRARTGTARR